MKIQSFKTHNLRNNEHFQFHTEFRDLVSTHGAENLKIKPLYDAYLPLYGRVDEALKKKEARSELDAVYFAIRDRLNALALIEDAEAYEAFIMALNTVIAKFNLTFHHKNHRNPNHPTKEDHSENNT